MLWFTHCGNDIINIFCSFLIFLSDQTIVYLCICRARSYEYKCQKQPTFGDLNQWGNGSQWVINGCQLIFWSALVRHLANTVQKKITYLVKLPPCYIFCLLLQTPGISCRITCSCLWSKILLRPEAVNWFYPQCVGWNFEITCDIASSPPTYISRP